MSEGRGEHERYVQDHASFGDKAYILSEITDYDKGLPVVLSASTENGVRIPCDVFPFVDEDDVLAMEFALYDTALAVRDDLLASAACEEFTRTEVLRGGASVAQW